MDFLPKKSSIFFLLTTTFIVVSSLPQMIGGQQVLCPSSCSCSSVDQTSSTAAAASLTVSVSVKCEASGLSKIPSDVPSDTNWLDLSRNGLDYLKSGSLDQLTQLVHLKLSQNSLHGLQDSVFQATRSIQILDLDLNNLSTLVQSSFVGAETLLHLDLSGNRLESIDGAFGGLKDLARLDLRNNRLIHLNHSTFRGLSNLRYLLLTANRIQTVDRRAFRPLEKLVYIVLKDNPLGERTLRFHFNSNFLTYVDVSECEFFQVPKGIPGSARYLQLRRNNLTELNRLTFVECPYVTILVLDENKIASIEDGTFANMTRLQQLWLNNNRLKHIPTPLPVSLERLLMDINRVEYVDDRFPALSQLNTLSLMGNNITHLAHDALNKLDGLKTLDLSNNKLQHIYGNSFRQLNQLRVLQLSSNPLQYFHSRCFHGLTELKTASLAYVSNEVSMHEDVFEDTKQLVKLDLDSSPGVINAFLSSSSLLSSLSGVVDLSMRSSDLTRLRSDFFQFFPNLTVVHISSTRWHCDRSIVWLRDWMKSTPVKLDDSDENRCSTPRSLHGRAIVSLEADEFAPITDSFTVVAIVGLRRFNESSLTTFLPPRTSRPLVFKLVDGSTKSSQGYRTDASSKPEVSNNYDETSSSQLLPPPPLPPPPSEGWKDEYRTDRDDGILFDDLEEFILNHFETKGYDDSAASSSRPPKTSESKTGMSEKGDTGERSTTTVSYSKNTLAIVAVTVTATLITAIVILAVIFHLTRDRRSEKKKTLRSKKPVHQKKIPYKHKNGILYYTTSIASGKPEPDPPDLLRKTTSGEVTTLVPGRDFNHEGPMRVYKWEDF